MKPLLTFLLFLLFSNVSFAQTTVIPDANFEQALIGLGLDTGVPDGLVLTASIDTVTALSVNAKNISNLMGIEDFSNLSILLCNNNPQLSGLDVSLLVNLNTLDCSSNNLSNLDFSKNTALIDVNCSNNRLFCFNIKNGNNTNLLNLIATNNPDLTCIEVDNISWSTINWTNVDAGVSFSLNCYNTCVATRTMIPDVNFEQALINRGYETGTPDGFIATSSIDTITSLSIKNLAINDLTGIEAFTSLTVLDCSNNYLKDLNVSKNTYLDYLICSDNKLRSLDVSKNPLLVQLHSSRNEIISLDVSKNSLLTHLYCGVNQLTSIDISQNDSLIIFWCYSNQISSIDISLNNILNDFYCSGNQLNCLNLKNGNPTNLIIRTQNNPNLTCIEVDDISYATSNWTLIDPVSSFSSDCNNNCSTCDITATYTYSNNGNGNYIFTNTSNGDSLTFDWSFGDGTKSSQESPNHTFSANGIYTVVLAISDSTIGSACMDYYIDTITVTSVVNPQQCVAGFSMYVDSTFNGVTVVNSSTGTNLTYLWDFGDGATSNQQYPTHSYTTAGPFNLCLTVDDGNGCIDTYCDSISSQGVLFKTGGFDINVVPTGSPVGVGVNENNTFRNTTIYPNPTTGTITIDLGKIKSNITSTLTNSLGQVILTQKHKSTNVITLDINEPKGVYFLKLETESGEFTVLKILKE